MLVIIGPMSGGSVSGPDRTTSRPATAPAWLAAACGQGIVAARPARWGFRHETWIVEMSGGTASVVQRRVDGSDPTNPVARTARDLVRAAGLPVPEPTDATRVADDLVVMLPLVDGTVAAELLRTVRGAQTVGRVCGGVAARIGAVKLTGVSLPRTWASGESLRAATQARLDRLAVDLPGETRRRLLAALDRSVARVDAARARLVHGDLAPVNVLVRDDRLAAVLDLDRLQIAHPLYDAAWFAWVVSNYHPDVADAACDAFARAAGLTVGSAADLAWLWPLQLLERLAEAQSAPERAMWTARLESIERSG